ncbi:hypothetical protein HDU85_005561 [Gaertneriomyces sp. JEL0708]|nr:hypothetical protein HDU85_005561 [Gaertneriomyces sp. JEL0708]
MSNPLDVIPTPQMATVSGGKCAVHSARLTLDPPTKELKSIARWAFAGYRFLESGNKTEVVIRLISTATATAVAREKYTLTVTPGSLVLQSPTVEGLARGAATVRQLLDAAPSKEDGIPCCIVSDMPRFEHRGLLLDCSRHFMEVEFVEKFIEMMAYMKFNRLHWHLVDDQGWRLEVPSLPKLTEVGAYRTLPSGEKYGGFYTPKDVQRVTYMAKKLGITVIPEIELPGHCMAALAAYPNLGCVGNGYVVPDEWGIFEDVYCAGKEEVFEFIAKVLAYVIEVFPDSPYIHIGGDEVPKVRWQKCSNCQERMEKLGISNEEQLQSYFVTRVATYLHKLGRIPIGWDEIADGGLPAHTTVQSWRGLDGTINAIRQNHTAISSPTSHCYLDYSLSTISLRKAWEFWPVPDGVSTDQAERVLGGEGCMWTERATHETVMGKVWPRALALVERMWSGPAVASEWDNFERRVMGVHKERMSKHGVEYGPE